MRGLPLLFALLLAPAGARGGETLGAEVLEVQGLASLEPLHTNLRPGQKLGEGDRVTVMSGARLLLRLDTGELVDVGPHTELALKRDGLGHRFLRLAHGSVLLLGSGARELELRTTQVRATCRGEICQLEHQLDQPTYARVWNGQLRARWTEGEALVSGGDDGTPALIYPSKTSPQKAEPRDPVGTETRLSELRLRLPARPVSR